MSDYQLGELVASIIWIAIFAAYAWQVRRERAVLNEAITELAEAITEHAKANTEDRDHLLGELEQLEHTVCRR